jgi:hypothetical protein
MSLDEAWYANGEPAPGRSFVPNTERYGAALSAPLTACSPRTSETW